MQRFQEIMVYPLTAAVDDPAVATASALAEHTGARLTCVAIETGDLSADAPAVQLARRARDSELRDLVADSAPAGSRRGRLHARGRRPGGTPGRASDGPRHGFS